MSKQAHSNDRYATPNTGWTSEAALKEEVQRKIDLLSKAKQRLAEANDLMQEGGKKSDEARTIASEASTQIVALIIAGSLNRAETSSLLRDQFGCKEKGGTGRVPAGDPKASQTPFGLGEDLRKRIVRMEMANDFLVNPEEHEGFFVGLDPADIAPVFERAAKGEISVWSAYDAFAKAKLEARDPIKMAFDPKKVIAFTAMLAPANAASMIWENKELRTAYDGLYSSLRAIGTTLGELDVLAVEEGANNAFDQTITVPPVPDADHEEEGAEGDKAPAAKAKAA